MTKDELYDRVQKLLAARNFLMRHCKLINMEYHRDCMEQLVKDAFLEGRKYQRRKNAHNRSH